MESGATASDFRRINIARLVQSLGGADAFAAKVGLPPSYISQLKHGHRNAGPRTARKIESALSMSVGALDLPPAPQQKSIGAWVHNAKAEIARKGLKYSDLAPLLGVTTSAVSHYLTGIREPSIAQLQIIAATLGMTTSELLGETSSQENAA